ncbi:DUF3017 domain-containing protein [Ruania albidiflava]|uniref:DUF3017 domain-containing protein n=1 Tax=Ruania albidiflava TaxID=366586 RepID=UPI000A008BB4|nr:DUF3017 domain-containing protein [Ruania albidiflava]
MSRTTPAPAGTHRRRRRPAMWVALAGIVLALVVTFAFGPRAGGVALAVELVALGFVRAVAQRAPYGISARSRAFDVTVLMGGGVVLAVLALTAQNM